MPEDSPREIQIGDASYKIQRFRGLKAALAGSLVSRVMREVPELQDKATEFRKRFREQNKVVITPGMAKMPRFADLELTSEDFTASGGNIELPEEPEGNIIMMNLWPDIFDLADKELRKFLAIIVIPNSELEAADDADDVDEVLAKWGKKLIRSGDIDELLELVVVGLEVLKEQLARKRDRLGKLKIPILQMLIAEDKPPEEIAEQNGHGETEATETEPSPPPSSSQPSSTDSPQDTDGIEEPSSMESPGMSLKS